MDKIGFIGAGTVGTALAVRLKEKGHQVVAVASRTRASAKKLADRVGCQALDTPQDVADATDIVFITTPDDSIPVVASQVGWHFGQSVLHCSGVDSLDVLEPARTAGARVGGFHPLQSFASIDHAIQNLPGSTFALEAEPPLLDTLQAMAEALGGDWVRLGAGDKVLYHAAAVMACNYFVTLVKLATDLWKNFGADTVEATKALLPLLKGTLNNIENVGIPNCLTGPIARGDLGTIRMHLEALEARAPELLDIYQQLGSQTVPISLAKGRIDKEKAEEMIALLKPAARTKKAAA
ncbi:MAG: DUF2520 domain-containing protein [Chloroflexi bacterium]|nr:DUF2520 domain-containing protein [Chloroflexota bacterium]